MLSDEERESFESEVIGHALRIRFGRELSRNLMPEDQVEKLETEVDSKSFELAKDIVRVSTVRERICKAFEAATEDVRDVAKIVTAALIPLSLASHPIVPMDALVFAWIAIIVWRAGVKTFCHDQAAKP